MPAISAKQQAMMAIAEHNPSKLHARNKAVLKMSKGKLHDFASTSGLRQKAAKKWLSRRKKR